MQPAQSSPIDVTEYEHIIRAEGWRRYDNNQRTGIEGMTNKAKARTQHTLGAAAEVAARIHSGLDPFAIQEDELGAPDMVLDGIKYDIKCVKTDYPILNVQHYDGVLERRKGWRIMVMYYEGFGWRFIPGPVLDYKTLEFVELTHPMGGHRSNHWSIDLAKWKSDTR